MPTLAPKLPLALSPVSQYEMIDNYTKLALQNLKMLILTIPGERIMDTDFGVGLPKFLFENNDTFVRSRIQGRISEQVSKYLPYIDILNIQFHSSLEDPTVSEHYLGMRIEFDIVPVGIAAALSLTLDGSEITSASEIVSYSL